MESTRHPQHRLEPHGRSPGSRRSGGGQLRLFDPDGGMPRWLRLGIDAWRLAVSGDRSTRGVGGGGGRGAVGALCAQ